jgi:hypothetical protein
MAVVPHTGAPARRRKASTRARASSACRHARAAQAGAHPNARAQRGLRLRGQVCYSRRSAGAAAHHAYRQGRDGLARVVVHTHPATPTSAPPKIAHAWPARAHRTRTSAPCSCAGAGRTAVRTRRSTIPRTAGGASENAATASRSTTESKHRELANACTTPSSGSSCAPTTHACGARSGQHATVPTAHPPADSRNRWRQPACHAAAMQRAKSVQACGCIRPRGTGR